MSTAAPPYTTALPYPQKNATAGCLASLALHACAAIPPGVLKAAQPTILAQAPTHQAAIYVAVAQSSPLEHTSVSAQLVTPARLVVFS